MKKSYGAEVFTSSPDEVKVAAALSEFAGGFLEDVVSFMKPYGGIECGLTIIVRTGGGCIVAGKGLDGDGAIALLEQLLNDYRRRRDAAGERAST